MLLRALLVFGFAPNTLVTPFCVLLPFSEGADLFYVASIHRRRNESDMSVVMKERRPLQADSCQRSFLLHALSVDFSQDGVVGFFLSIQYQESFSSWKVMFVRIEPEWPGNKHSLNSRPFRRIDQSRRIGRRDRYQSRRLQIFAQARRKYFGHGSRPRHP